MTVPETLLGGSAAIIADLPMLQALPEDARRLVIEGFEPESFDFGSTIVEEGEPGEALYVIVSGAARVLKRRDDGGEVTIEKGRVQQSNFHDVRTLRINEAPAIEVHLVRNFEKPGGIGEPGTALTAPAFCRSSSS